MKALITVLAVIIVIVLGYSLYRSPSVPAEMTAAEIALAKAEVDARTNAWWDAWQAFDWERGLSFMEDSPETTWTGAGETVYSVAEMREVWPPMMAGFARQDLDFTNSRTVVLAPDIVWTLREGNYVLTDTSGAVVGQGQFNETAVWVKREGEWRVLLGHDDDTTVPVGGS